MTFLIDHQRIKMKYLVFLFVGITTMLGAQDIDLGKENACAMPGVTNKSPGKGLVCEYRFQPKYRMDNLNGQSREVDHNSRFNFKLKIPVIIKPSLTVLGGIQYQQENYDFDESSLGKTDLLFSRLNNSSLRMTRVSFYVTKSLNEKFYLGFMSDAVYSGDYANLSEDLDRFASYRATVALGYKPNEKTEYGFGILYSQGLRRTNVLPAIYYNKTFNEKWGMELTLPVKLKARYNISPKSLLLFGSDFDSRTYSVNASNEGEYIYLFRRGALSVNAVYQHQLKGWLWFQAQAGYNMSFNNRVDDLQSGEVFRLNQSNAPFLSFGIFLSPSGCRK